MPLVSLMTLYSLSSLAQSAAMADTMRENGKIYVVIGVVVLIFAVLFAYLIRLDIMLRKVEKEGGGK